ncbi:PQQ-binding-like beta-propeller repeat protein [Rhodanobacter sp. A1T4]|uniref:outer membrane protein assembly factor BamB family protein n=1 Tax=Rhodanobacter sp. A1T4 TaxID=2723087 RepID=UPI00162233E8|nr:PQQ-binding-like beta-propeller repeat protein [Rhodanobacter sp. A1T4]MBB6247912.1 PQQ-dependent dehydrogenase (methanol/ethanol family) [Rhodanobacter sp. A1T4]
MQTQRFAARSEWPGFWAIRRWVDHRHRAKHFALAALLLLAVYLPTAVSAASSGSFTAAQAQAGAAVYSQECSVCHGSKLQGGAAPALSGATFGASLKTNYPTAEKLYGFISSQMPVSNPGSLSKTQYEDTLAFILAQNDYPAGSTALDAAHLDSVALLPYPAQNNDATTANANLEIQNIGISSRMVYGKLPDKASVTITDAMMASPADHPADWLLHGRDYANQRFSPLKEINDSNVKSLTAVALVQTGITSSFETTPIVVNGVMYATTPVVDSKMKIIALHADTGDIIWESTYNVGNFKICCGPVNRGVAVGYGNVYVATLDARLIALNAATGDVLWNVGVADPTVGYSETMAPQLYKGKVIVGSSGGEWAIRGFVAAYDATTGKQAWRWQSTDPKSFAGDAWQRGGGMVWTTPAVDPERGLLIFSTGNPNPDLYGAGRKGDNLYTDSIVALNVDTGKLAWYYQEVPHDVWDYDAVSNVVLFDVQDTRGKTIPAAGEAGKTGWFYIVDRRNGKLIRKSQPFVDQSKNMFAQPTKEGVQMLPGANGGAEWSPPAYSPLTHAVYILGMNQLMTFTTGDDPGFQPGSMRLGSSFTNVPKDPIQNGTFTAINVDTGNIAWQYHAAQPLIGGALATAGNLVFMGEGDGYFDAFDATSGKKLWRFNLGAGVNAPPISYSVDGVQYIAVGAGGNFQMGFAYGDTIAIFKLPK